MAMVRRELPELAAIGVIQTPLRRGLIFLRVRGQRQVAALLRDGFRRR